LQLRNDLEEFKNDLVELAGLRGSKDAIREKIEELKQTREDLVSELSAKRRELGLDVSVVGGLIGDANKVWELITNEDKLRDYEAYVNSLPVWQRANFDAAIIQHKEDIDKTQEAIGEKLQDIAQNRDGKMFSLAKDMYNGRYQEQDRQIITQTEEHFPKTPEEEKSNSSPNPRGRRRP